MQAVGRAGVAHGVRNKAMGQRVPLLMGTPRLVLARVLQRNRRYLLPKDGRDVKLATMVVLPVVQTRSLPAVQPSDGMYLKSHRAGWGKTSSSLVLKMLNLAHAKHGEGNGDTTFTSPGKQDTISCVKMLLGVVRQFFIAVVGVDNV